MRYIKAVAALLIISFLISSCSFSKNRTVTRSFYYWKSEFLLTKHETATMKTLKINRIYLKFFDVAWEGAPAPAAPIRFGSPVPAFVSLVPAVFITNETLANLPADQVKDLAGKITGKIDRIIRTNHLRPIAEIQIDSDWTLQTRDKYFALLREIKSRLPSPIRLSATIRLHQIKYRNLTGVPPVDRGMLMFYNLAPVNRVATKNSIIDLNIGKTYTATLGSYPLPLDVALPIFSWGVIFQDDHFIGLANQFRRRELINDPAFKMVDRQYFQVKKDVFRHQTQLYQGDSLRVEESDSAVLKECAAYLGNKISGKGPVSVALFHFDRMNLRGFSHAQITSVFNSFR